jgi:hypothetical protein
LFVSGCKDIAVTMFDRKSVAKFEVWVKANRDNSSC